MTLTSAEAALRRELATAGATPFEIAAVLLACREVSVIELGHSEAWRREMRGPHGEWVHGGSVQVMNRTQANRSRQIARARQERLVKAEVSRQLSGTPGAVPHEQFFEEQVKPHVEAKAQEAIDQATKAAQEHTQKAIEAISAAGEQQEKHKAAMKAATEASVLVAGGILAAIEAKLGVPTLYAIASAAGPTLLQIIIEFFKKL